MSLHATILAVAHSKGVFRTEDLPPRASVRRHLSELVKSGELVRASRGLYRLPGGDFTESHTLVEAARAAPRAVICLLSALLFHGLTTELPSEVWLALPRGAWRPRPSGLHLRLAYFSEPALSSGVEEHTLEGVRVRVYSPAKTVADCFKYRNKIGTSIALDALRDAWRARKATSDELWKFAKVCRVQRIMTPYMETLE